MFKRSVLFLAFFLGLWLNFSPFAQAGLLRDRGIASEDVKTLRDVAYGPHEDQRMDVYLPQAQQSATNAPVILMVHGGGWRRGDKDMGRVVSNKVARWVPQGFILISVNYRMVPDADPVQQADDIALALATAQKQAPTWGGDPDRFILMGHSAGAHLVTFLTADPSRALKAGARPWLGTVALDSGAFNVETIMRAPHFDLYDTAFGADPTFWVAASPFHQIVKGNPPLLAVCSTRRAVACQQARAYGAKAATLGNKVGILEEDMSHGEINSLLGKDETYTQAVEAFILPLVGR